MMIIFLNIEKMHIIVILMMKLPSAVLWNRHGIRIIFIQTGYLKTIQFKGLCDEPLFPNLN